MSDLVGNPEDRFSHDAAQIRSWGYKTFFKLSGINVTETVDIVQLSAIAL